MYKSFKFILILFGLNLSACATVTPEYALPDQSLTSPAEPGKTRVIFYNKSNPLLFSDASGLIGIKVHGVGIANVGLRRYVQIHMVPGVHELQLSHWDIFTFRDTHKINITKQTTYVAVMNTIYGTTFTASTIKPENFETKYQAIKN